jgi:hypothetical protein
MAKASSHSETRSASGWIFASFFLPYNVNMAKRTFHRVERFSFDVMMSNREDGERSEAEKY